MIPVGWSLAVSAGLFAAGILTLTVHRSAIRILLGVELLLNAANLNFVAFAQARGGDVGAHVTAIIVMAAAAAEAAVALALAYTLFATLGSSDAERATELSR